ncbi:MAG: phosphoribosylaminoimidazolesuccinocarboxamide synthase [Rhodospirillales bacterium]|nr:phosphoribosylaminoimidazolesuccinocarboxamide synthase [Rhodospirillales bacterium]
MARRRQIYEGKAKILYEGPEPNTVVQHFKDEASCQKGAKVGVITGKGVLNNRISEHLMSYLDQMNIPTHFIRRLNMREQLVRKVEIVPVGVIVRNWAAGGFAERFGMEDGEVLPRTIIEYYLKAADLDKPLITEEHIAAFGWSAPQELDEMLTMALRINDFVSGLFRGVGIKLVDLRLEFGRYWIDEQPRIILANEISPDNCRLWDVKTNERMDIDRFRKDLGSVAEGYQEVARRLGILPEGGPSDVKGPDTLQ